MGLHRVRYDGSDLAAAAAAGQGEGFPGDSVVKNPPAKQQTPVPPMSQEDLLE